MRGGATGRKRRLAAATLLLLGVGAAYAQSTPEERAKVERVAAEGAVIGSAGGAGRDPQTSVAQPMFSASRSTEVTTSVEAVLGAAGDPGGYRAFLADRGIVFDVIYFAEAFNIARGGMRRGTATLGMLDVDLDINLEKLTGWKGGAIRTTFYQPSGHGASRSYVGNLLTVSDIEAISSTRLNEVWFEQQLFDNRFAFKIGQLATDSEYMVSQTAVLFANGTFGWPAILGTALRGGGPAYPLAIPGARVKVVPNENLSFQAGIYDGDPGGPDPLRRQPDPQKRNIAGTRLPLSDPGLLIGEVSYAYNLRAGAPGEPGTVTFGGWYQLGRVDALARDGDGRSLADPASSGVARRLSGNGGLYGLVDQTIYREPDDPNDGASVFVRAGGAPSDRNLIDLYVDAGIAYRGFFAGRSDDTMGLAVGLARISPDARRRDALASAYGTPTPRRSAEAVIEATYQAVLAPGMALQPTIQYVFKPGGSIANPRDPDGSRIRNAAVFGLRATIRY